MPDPQLENYIKIVLRWVVSNVKTIPGQIPSNLEPTAEVLWTPALTATNKTMYQNSSPRGDDPGHVGLVEIRPKTSPLQPHTPLGRITIGFD